MSFTARYGKTPMHCHRGFSFIELVAVIILIGIISTVVVARFPARDGFVEYAVRDQLISAFRYAQQRAMYDHSGNCYRLNIDGNGFGPQREGSYFGVEGEVSFSGDYSGLSITPATAIYFDGLGATYSVDCGDTPIANPGVFNPLLLTVNPGGLSIEVYSTGYIREL